MSTTQDKAQRAVADANNENPPRKRRKRAPAAGAATDCFTCSSRSVKCDRRRPYCSQCLEDGKDCAGYKTQLTWGNGVASRGKLRGLTLPVAGTQKTTTPTSTAKAKKRASHQQLQPQLPLPNSHSDVPILPPLFSGPAHSSLPPFQFDRPYLPRPVLLSYPTPHNTWEQSASSTAVKTEPGESSYSTASASLTSPQDALPYNVGLKSNAAYTGPDRTSPLSYSASSPESAYLGRILGPSPSAPAPVLRYPLSPEISSSYDPAFFDHGKIPPGQRQDESYAHNEFGTLPHPPQQVEPTVGQGATGVFGDDVEDIPRNVYADECAIAEDDSALMFSPMTLNSFNLSLSPFAGMSAIGATPRLQYLINYYAEVISPVIVAFDGPSNPYRTQILRLAANSETLQHAIAALAASNLRQRRETGLSTGKTDPARRSSMAHLSLTNEPWHGTGLLSPQEQAREEALHKGIAISSLNKQLASHTLRKDDSILATLLMLCLFHICDSGIAKFQTQFAGVKRLLFLRKIDRVADTKEAKWFTRMFTWFDAMTATVNDREGQLQGYHLDISALSDEEWALENLAGCDGRLFKTIAHLGRLNVLSQGKEVRENPTIVSRPPHQNSQVPTLDYTKFDGNGWMRMVDDENLFSSKSVDPTMHTQFWREWREIRQTLMDWQLDTSLFDSSSPAAPDLTYEQRIDLNNISESFRYSALLYTERLANPDVPSTDQAIRNWVQLCLQYIKAVKSDVYLLWPLFITGSECVDAQDRHVIRQRCLDIQKDSGFLNNQSCLELLEKVWRSYDEKKAKRGMGGANADANRETGFRFSTIMKQENNEGEYIVV